MKKNAKIAVIGSINMDLVINAPRIPLSGETLLGRDFSMIPGGKGANQAVAASRFNAEVQMIGCLGEDAFGQSLLHLLQQEGIDTRHVAVLPDVSTGIALITVSDEGGNTILLSSGANARLTPEKVRQAEEAIEEADILLLQLEVPLEAIEEAVLLAKRHDVCIILDPAPARPLPNALLQKVDIITPNETEANILVGREPSDTIDPALIIKSLSAAGVRQTILTAGENGVYYQDAEKVIHSPAYPVQAVDTTAAGDCFNAGLAVMLAEGRPLVEAIQFAQKAAALSVTRFGAQPSLPMRAEVEQMVVQG